MGSEKGSSKPKVSIRYGKVSITGKGGKQTYNVQDSPSARSGTGSSDSGFKEAPPSVASFKESSVANETAIASNDSGYSEPNLTAPREENRDVLKDVEEKQKKSKWLSLYSTKKSGLQGTKKKFFQSYYPVGDNATVLLQSIYLSRYRGYLAGNLFKIDKLPPFEDGGPAFVRLHLTLLPSRKHVWKTMWIQTDKKQRVVVNEYYKYDLDRKNRENEKELRVRVYGTRNPDVSAGSRCVGECVVDIDAIEKERGGMNFWINLSRDKK